MNRTPGTVVVGVDLGGTAINCTLVNENEEFLIDGLCEHPALVAQGPDVCLRQLEDGIHAAVDRTGSKWADVAAVGLDTPGPASAEGVLSTKGSTNFGHAEWQGFDIRGALAARIGKPVTYLNDGNAAALWGHFSMFGTNESTTSVSAIVGTGLGGGVITGGRDVKGRSGFGGELGHVLIPWQQIPGLDGLDPKCNCWRSGDLESLCSLTAIRNSLLPHFLKKFPDHELNAVGDVSYAAKLVRGLAEAGDPMCREIFRVQAHALGLFFDIMVNTFDPDAMFVGGGAIETTPAFQNWFVDEIRAGMPIQREEQVDIPICIMPNGDTAGARGAAVDALAYAKRNGLLLRCA